MIKKCLGCGAIMQVQDKNKIGELSVWTLLQDLVKKDEYFALTKEFNAKQTADSKFASNCDKLELMLQMKLYETQPFIT